MTDIKAEYALNDFLLNAQKLSKDEIEALESSLTEDPENIEARLQILAYYQNPARSNESSRQEQFKHTLWIIDHEPEHSVCAWPWMWLGDNHSKKQLLEAKEHWQKQAEDNPESAEIQGHAGIFLIFTDRQLGQHYLERAKQLDPKNFRWPENLARNYWWQFCRDPQADLKKCASAIQENTRLAMSLDSRQQVFLKSERLKQLAHTAVYLERYGKAREYAQQYNEIAKDQGSPLVLGTLIEALIDLKEGKEEAAWEKLKEQTTKRTFSKWRKDIESGGYPQDAWF